MMGEIKEVRGNKTVMGYLVNNHNIREIDLDEQTATNAIAPTLGSIC